ncbi:hypothetical protein IEQ34_000325 [Dendrobium chrysotoxum]|uniref:Uncharacterized protein n=1 Tax=Dendrobium chrysotoxum TaxID=161865 RepID=A0AAV7HQ69_DENCH|nr:hypothetical protein IEQ34_000325 [Dendrobium chrysotoxum]
MFGGWVEIWLQLEAKQKSGVSHRPGKSPTLVDDQAEVWRDIPYSNLVHLFSVEAQIGDHTSTKIFLAKGDRPAAQYKGLKKPHKVAKEEISLPNDLVMKVPKKSNRACCPPTEFLTVYEFSLQAGLRFPPPPELIDISATCGVNLSQFFCRVMSIIISKWLDIRTRDPSKSWNNWNLLEKWRKLEDLPNPLHVRAKDLLKMLNPHDVDTLDYEICYLRKYIDNEYLFKVRLSTQIPSKRLGNDSDPQPSKKKMVEKTLTIIGKGRHSSPSKSHIPEYVLKYQCVRR